MNIRLHTNLDLNGSNQFKMTEMQVAFSQSNFIPTVGSVVRLDNVGIRVCHIEYHQDRYGNLECMVELTVMEHHSINAFHNIQNRNK